MSERRVPFWGVLIPDRGAWPRLLVVPSSYLLVIALVATMSAKLSVIRRIAEVELWFGRWLTACAGDTAFFLGLACVLAVGERVHRRMVLATIPLAALVAIVAVLNAGYLAISGEQLSWPVLMLGLERFGDVRSIIGATIPISPLALIAGLVLVVGPPVATTIALRRAGQQTGAFATGATRARAAGACAVVGLLVWLIVPPSREYGLSRLHGNAVLRTYWGLATGAGTWRGERGLFAGYEPRALVEPDTIAAIRAGARPNVVVVVLESTRRESTGLGDPKARTPNLVALARRGLEVTHGRAVIPQTTKSVWSMLCGRLPLMQFQVYENTSGLDVQCLPEVVDAAGYRTLFVQSAMGKFEDRPRLVRQLGFREFLASEHITGQLLGYLASDDESLVEPLARWIDQAPDQPFFATVLTSATHHPYHLSDAIIARAKADGLPHEEDRDCYDREIEAADRMLGGLLEALAARGLAERTIVAVVGDHGEGFGDMGVRQHGANFYEEGLRVPWVLAGPGVPRRRLDAAASLVDLAPTLLDLLGGTLSPRLAPATPGRSLLRALPEDRPLPFTCFYDHACRGYVVDRTKVVYVPETKQTFWFDLDRDPRERSPRPLTAALDATLQRIHDLIARHRTHTWLRRLEVMDQYPQWFCPANRVCSAIDPIRR